MYYDFELEKTVDEKILLKKLQNLPLEKDRKRSLEVDVTNTDRTFGTILGAEITRRYDEEGLSRRYIYRLNVHGAGGQSFGAFIPKGLTLEACR